MFFLLLYITLLENIRHLSGPVERHVCEEPRHIWYGFEASLLLHMLAIMVPQCRW